MGITFEVVVHFGTLCSIVIYYKTEILNLIKALFRFIKSPMEAKSEKDVKVIGFILISMIPAFIVGMTLKDHIEGIFMNPILVCGMLIVTGIVLFLTKFSKNPTGEITTKRAILIGIAQAFAMIPGISRSGSTISTSLYLGVSREEAANFSFLMVIPVIAGAMILQMGEVLEAGISSSQISILLVGFLTAFISGYYAQIPDYHFKETRLSLLCLLLLVSGWYWPYLFFSVNTSSHAFIIQRLCLNQITSKLTRLILM